MLTLWHELQEATMDRQARDHFAYANIASGMQDLLRRCTTRRHPKRKSYQLSTHDLVVRQTQISSDADVAMEEGVAGYDRDDDVVQR